MVSLAYAVYKKSCSNILSLSLFWFDTSSTGMNVWADIDILGVDLFLI